jgi:hypothetical protein
MFTGRPIEVLNPVAKPMPNQGIHRTRNHAVSIWLCYLQAHWPRGCGPVMPAVSKTALEIIASARA